MLTTNDIKYLPVNDVTRVAIRAIVAAKNLSAEDGSAEEARLAEQFERRIYMKTLELLGELTDVVFRGKELPRTDPGIAELYAFLEALGWHMAGVDVGTLDPGTKFGAATQKLEEMIAALE